MPLSEILTLGHSPDPDDAFMFYALAEHKIETHGYRFQHILQDIQTLNERATRGELHISAISIHAYASVLDKYALLPCGASMGDGYGPMIITLEEDGLPAADDHDAIRAWLRTRRAIAIPGALTSAALAHGIFLGERPENTIVVPFDEIFDYVRAGKAEAGLIIHEGQVTWERDGFTQIIDYGAWWKAETGLPLPLGGNVIRKDIPPAERKIISDILLESIQYGLANRAAGVAHAMPLARGLDTALADQFIGMYVNELTLDYGEAGRESIRQFLDAGHRLGFLPAPVELEFVE